MRIYIARVRTTANQKKLFFNLRKAKRKIFALEEGDLRSDQVTLIAPTTTGASIVPALKI